MRCRALFVDDEPSIRGIYEMLGAVLGEEYTITTAAGPDEAREQMASDPADIIICDLVMPGTCGAELLLELSSKYPACGRIVVSGFADQITMAKCLTVAHRYFTKPFSPLALTSAIEQLHLTRASTDERVAKLVGSIQSLPVPSQTYFTLNNMLNAHSVSLDSIAAVIEKDPALCSKLLQAANSAMFGAQLRSVSMVQAIQVLGIETIRTLLLGVQVFELCSGREFKPFLARLWEHSVSVASSAKRLRSLAGDSMQKVEQAFLAGLLHDLGKVVLAASCPAEYRKIISHHDDHGAEFRAEELAAFGATHAEAGAYLLSLWGLPEEIVAVVAKHHHLETGNPLIEAVQAAHGASSSGAVASAPINTGPKTILIATTDQCEIQRLTAILRARGFLTFTAAHRGETFRMLHDLSFLGVIADERLFVQKGESLVKEIRDFNATAEIFLMKPEEGASGRPSALWEEFVARLERTSAIFAG